MTDLTEQQIDLIADRIAARIAGACECGLQPEAKKEMPHLLGMISDIGGQNYSSGIEIIREMGKRYSRISKTSGYVSHVILCVMFTAMLTGAGTLIVKGFISIIHSIQGAKP